jgi:hypothetical protein
VVELSSEGEQEEEEGEGSEYETVSDDGEEENV